MNDPIERQRVSDLFDAWEAAELDHHIPKILRDRLKAIPSADSSIPISWIEKYIDWLNGSGNCGKIIASSVSLMVHRWKGDCPHPVNFFPDDKRKENTKWHLIGYQFHLIQYQIRRKKLLNSTIL